jgi:hypothetical protein
MQTKITIESESCWLDRPEVTRLEVLRLLGYTARKALDQILKERRILCQATQ